MKQLLANSSQFFTKDRLIALAVTILLLALQGWTWLKRYPLIGLRKDEIAKVEKFDSEVAQLFQKWSAKEEDRIKTEMDLKRAFQRLFEGRPVTDSWSTQIENPLDTLTFTVMTDKAIEHPDFPDSLLVVPTIWTVRDEEGSNDLHAMLAFIQNLTAKQPKWIDLVELVISGNEITQTRAEFGLRLWFKNETAS